MQRIKWINVHCIVASVMLPCEWKNTLCMKQLMNATRIDSRTEIWGLDSMTPFALLSLPFVCVHLTSRVRSSSVLRVFTVRSSRIRRPFFARSSSLFMHSSSVFCPSFNRSPFVHSTFRRRFCVTFERKQNGNFHDRALYLKVTWSIFTKYSDGAWIYCAKTN